MGCVVIAPDKFKGTLTAPQVAAHVAAGLKRARPGTETIQVPIADGGDGTVDAAEAAGYRKIEIGVRGPTGRPVTAAFAFSDGTAVIEAAQACGLSRLPGGALAPLTASSQGVGELILAAARMRAKRIVLGLGGVATTDGGSGMIRAFGAKLVDEAGAELPPGGAALARLHQLDLRKMRDLSSVEFIVASDVNNPLLGEQGAAGVYAPQKGASPEDVGFLEEGLTHWADAVEQALGTAHRDTPGAGAAGGLGFAALAFLRATVQSGIDLMLDLVSFPAILDGATLVITGEGTLDAQTLHGKAPAGVAKATAAAVKGEGAQGGIPVIAVTGQNALTADQVREVGLTRAYALTDIEPDVDRCVADAGRLVESLSEQVARDWLPAS